MFVTRHPCDQHSSVYSVPFACHNNHEAVVELFRDACVAVGRLQLSFKERTKLEDHLGLTKMMGSNLFMLACKTGQSNLLSPF